jgi:Zn ribbon nucleic-acid-binding protein
MGNEVELKPKDNYGGSELCRSRRNHVCTLLCDEKSDTHYELFLAVCPLCRTDKPELSRDEKQIPVIFCRKCGLELFAGPDRDVYKLIVRWNTRTSTSSPLTEEQAKERAAQIVQTWRVRWKRQPYSPVNDTEAENDIVDCIASELVAVATAQSVARETRLRNQAESIIDSVMITDPALYEKESSDRQQLREAIFKALKMAYVELIVSELAATPTENS